MRLLLQLLLLLSISPAWGGTLLSPEKIRIIKSGQEALFNSDWKKASMIFDSLRLLDRTDPAGYLFSATTLQAEMIDCEDDLNGRRLFHLLDSVRYYAELRLSDCDRRDSAICFLYLGHQAAYRSLYEAHFGSRFSALTTGLKAKGYYRDGLRADSTLYDLFLGMGSYHYWKSVKAGILRTAGLFHNDKELGIAEIRLAMDSSLFSSGSARAALIGILLNEKEYDSAISLCQQMLARYPSGRTFRWPLAEAQYESRQFEPAAENYRIIFESTKDRPGNFFNLIESAYWLCYLNEVLGRKQEADIVRHYIRSMAASIPRDIKHRQKSKLAYLSHH